MPNAYGTAAAATHASSQGSKLQSINICDMRHHPCRHSGRGDAAIRLRLQDCKRERQRRLAERAPRKARV